MTGFLTRLAARTLGQVPLAQPLRLSNFSGRETFEPAGPATAQAREGEQREVPSASPNPPAPTRRTLTRSQEPAPVGTEAPFREPPFQQGAPTPGPGQNPPSFATPPAVRRPSRSETPSGDKPPFDFGTPFVLETPTGNAARPVPPTRPPQLVPTGAVEEESPVPDPASREPSLLPALPDPPPRLVGTTPPELSVTFSPPTALPKDSPVLPRNPPPAAVIRPVDAPPKQEIGGIVRRVPGLPSQQEPPKEASPTLQITIGRVEVRAISPPKLISTPPPRPRTPSLSLNDYLKQRNHVK